VLALGTAAGPLVLTQTANVGFEWGLAVGGAFASVALLANAAVVLFSRLPVLGQVLLMAASCVLVTGVFFFGATAYLAGRQKAIEEAQNPEPPAPQPAPQPPEPAPPERAPRPPTHVDKAYQNGVSALEDGPAEVTALAVGADGTALGIGGVARRGAGRAREDQRPVRRGRARTRWGSGSVRGAARHRSRAPAAADRVRAAPADQSKRVRGAGPEGRDPARGRKGGPATHEPDVPRVDTLEQTARGRRRRRGVRVVGSDAGGADEP
jgi:hypothetical protein